MDVNERTPVLRVRPKDIAKNVIVVGDPNRAADAASLLDNAKEIAFYREYRTFTGEFSGKRITISSHGVGAAGASVCFEELLKCGVSNVIRAGTCGAMVEGIHDGDLIIATGAIREDGCSEKLAPMSYPALADRHIITALEEASIEMGIKKLNVGMMITQGYFYPGMLPNSLDLWLPTGIVLGVEMELATLLVMAGLRGVHAGGIFTSDGNMTLESDPDKYDPHREVVEKGKINMLKVALRALTML